MAKGDEIVPIPGTKRVSRLEENAHAAEIELSPQDLETLDEAFADARPMGTRYSERDMALLNH
jgi:aryl-alcohol dehydrogenase-like predicted oxidoreductase